MEKIYRTSSPENIPWNIETPPDIVQDIVKTEKVKPCKVIELGCGTGNYVIYLSASGFIATGVDISKTAIEMASFGYYGGFDNYESQSLRLHTVGVATGTPLVNGADQNVTYAASKDTISQNLLTDA